MATALPNHKPLVSRAVPDSIDSSDQIAGLLDKLSIEDEAFKKKCLKEDAANAVSPADFITLQSIRSAAIARKTNTTSKFTRGGPALFADLLNIENKDEKLKKREGAKIEQRKEKVEPRNTKESLEKLEKERKEKEEKLLEELIARGPIKNFRCSDGHHPYLHTGQILHGTTAQTTVHDISAYSGYGNGYECGSTWSYSPETIGSISASTTPDTVLSSDGYRIASPIQNSPKTNVDSPFSDIYAKELAGALTPSAQENELPEFLQDFILKFSNQYSDKEKSRIRAPSADSGVSSPMSARSASQSSPNVPQGTCSSPTTPSTSQTRLSPRINDASTAKQKLHALINENDLAAGFHWACTMSPTALSTRDADGDTLLHIVVAHLDLGKIYALCETLRKTKSEEVDVFSQTNKYGETPLFVAVVQRSVEVAEYLLELGANSNVQTSRGDKDTALHHSAARGLVDIIELLSTHQDINLNHVNANGETAILSAVKNHGNLDELTEKPVNNKTVIGILLDNGADPSIVEKATGKSVVHYAVEKMDVEILDLLKLHIPEDTFTDLANLADLEGNTAVDILSSSKANKINDCVRQDIYIRLLASGAIGKKSIS